MKSRVPLGERVKWIWSYWRPHRYFMVFLAAFTLVSSAAAVGYPLVFKIVIDRVTDVLGEGDPERLRMGWILRMLALVGLGRVIAGFYPSFRAWMNLKLEMDVREDAFRHILRKDYRFSNRFRTGDVVTRLTDDVADYPKIAWFCCSGIFRAVDSSSKLIFCVVVMLYIKWQLALLSLLPVPAMLYLFYILRGRLSASFLAQQQAISKTNDMLESTFSGIRIVKAFCSERGQLARLWQILKDRIGIQLRVAKLVVLVHSFDTVAGRVGQVVVLAVGGWMVINGNLTLGSLYVFFVYLDILVWPMMDLPNLFVTAKQCFVCIDRVEEIKNFPDALAHRGEGEQIGAVAEMAMDKVSFAYDGGPQVLSDVSFEVPAGKRVAIVGPVASGKSTLMKIVAGLITPTSGEFHVNGRPLGALSWESYRRLVGYVPQESVLFSESIRHNVGFGREGDEPWIRRCLNIARMEEELETLSGGLDTILGEQGSLVSGGQKQRIAIARSLAGRPQILLLDDCTASLDARNEDEFWKRVEQAFPNVTLFLVSHRLATIRRANHILVLDGGKLVDSGTHEELSARCEVYKEFLVTERKRSHLRKG